MRAQRSRTDLRVITPSSISTQDPMLRFHIEPGHEEMWRAMSSMNQNAVTASELAAACGTTSGRAETYLRGLARQGIAIAAGTTTDLQRLYQVKVKSPTPTVLNGQGRPCRDYAIRQALWRTMKMYPVFTISELAAFASTDELEIPVSKAGNYADALFAAKYLERHMDRRNGRQTTYRFLKTMNTGPFPPRLYTSDIVFDVNTQQVMTDCAVAREDKL